MKQVPGTILGADDPMMSKRIKAAASRDLTVPLQCLRPRQEGLLL